MYTKLASCWKDWFGHAQGEVMSMREISTNSYDELIEGQWKGHADGAWALH